jgi:RNA polymerase-interacting CarD/CdnL/TRCF family regulator
MNPGPAPRPPVDRPRLTTTTTTSSVATSFSQMSLNSPSTPTLSIFPNSSTVSLSQSKSPQNGQGGVAIIKEGYVRCKEDKFLAGWNQRYLILREFRLDFLKNETGKVVLSIQLSNVTGVTRSEDTKMAFEITRVANPKDAGSKSAIINRDVPTKTIICEVKNDDEIYDWIDKIYERCPGMGGVSNPTNFSHRVHVGFDPRTGAFVGLPAEWEKLLTASAITKEDYKKNPQAVIEVLEFYSDIKMREQNPQYYSSLAPTPPASNSPSSQFGQGNSIAPPRPPPPNALQRLDTGLSQRSVSDRPAASSPQSQRKPSDADRAYEVDRMREMADQDQRRRMEEDRRAREEQERREQETYNASLPKARVPLAKQELGGYGGSDSDSSVNGRYNPSRPAPQAPSSTRQQPPGSLRQMTAQRPAPPPPTVQTNGHSIQKTGESPTSNGPPRPPGSRNETPGSPVNDPRSQTSAARAQNNGVKPLQQAQGPPPTRLPAPVQPVKPLNIANKQAANKPTVPDGIRQAEAALTKKPEPRQKEVRMSSMTENEVMEKLKSVVSKENPQESYSKQRKIGQGASGSVYVARVKENSTSPVARELYRQYGPRGQVAIKQMDLRSQPRKELIVNEIIVMKDSQHANIVNFLDSFLQEQNNELWVVMEFMEGGALTDVIDNNPVIQEDQIATICFEVCTCSLLGGNEDLANVFFRPAKGWLISTARTLFTVTSRAIMFCSTVLAMSKLVSSFD